MPTRPKKRPARKRVETRTAPADLLTVNERAFVLEYEANGRNASKAYRDIHPDVTPASSAVLGHRMLRNVKVAAALAENQTERFARLEMKADEALAIISEHARADIGDRYDEAGNELPIHQWPARLRLAVKSIKAGPFGDSITLVDSLRAAELMAQAGGKLRAGSLTITFDHAKYLGATPPED